jgi:ATP/maltotriose-dependent transcriptional regulator MalT
MRAYETYEHVKALCQESLQLNAVIGDRRGVAASLVGLAGLAVEQADAIHAARLLAAAEQLLNDMSAHLMFLDQLEYERHLNSVHAQLSPSTFGRVWEEGRSMSMERAIAFALEDPTILGDEAEKSLIKQPASQTLVNSLTERELEILRLVSSGSSTLEVAQQLYLSIGTVRWYFKQIYSKLDVHGRVQAIARARELKLLE